jgi:hypothetical protein
MAPCASFIVSMESISRLLPRGARPSLSRIRPVQARRKVESLFGLFDAVYRLFDAVYRQRPQDEARRALLAWLKAQAQAGFPGWREYLMPLIHEDMGREAVEALCDAIRYH